jgi:hypothetical protein
MTDDTIAFLDTVVMISGGFNKSGEAAPDAEWNLDQLAEFLGPAYGEVSPDGIRDPRPPSPGRVKLDTNVDKPATKDR